MTLTNIYRYKYLPFNEYSLEIIRSSDTIAKNNDWEYEQEERVIDAYRAPGIYEFSADRIVSSVIAGCKMSDDDFGGLRDSIEKRNADNNLSIRLCKARQKSDKYELFVNDHPRLKSIY
ncbi:MAG: hypothetical protein COB61_003190 [Thiotrichales bacterium]|nr:hypothetical protein [Thiotrichales bacterium]